MRNCLSIILGLLLTAPVFPQDLIHNPARPLNPEAWRILRLEPLGRQPRILTAHSGLGNPLSTRSLNTSRPKISASRPGTRKGKRTAMN